jgi:(p)ppGpp synthase/HD superfamily hydrolase
MTENNMTIYNHALMFATLKHLGKKRKVSGDDYIIHPLRVATNIATDIQKIAALLHDTIEDTNTTYAELLINFGNEIAELVQLLSHNKADTYMQYIEKVCTNRDAAMIKIADINDNLADFPSDRMKEKAQQVLPLLKSVVN